MRRLSSHLFGDARSPLAFIGALWRSRELLWQFTVRNVEIRHKGSYLGLIWSMLYPLLMMSLYVFVFGYIFGGRFTGTETETTVDFALALFLGLTIFQIFAEVLALAPTAIVSYPSFVKKVVFPLEILPAANVGASVFHMLIALAMVLVGVLVLGPGLSLRIVWLPVILLPVLLLSLGMAWFFAAIGVFFRDINPLVGFLSQALMFGSAIFYPIRAIPPAAWAVMQYNPFLLAVQLARDAIMWDQPINLMWLGYLAAISLMSCIGGYWCFRKMSPAFADVL